MNWPQRSADGSVWTTLFAIEQDWNPAVRPFYILYLMKLLYSRSVETGSEKNWRASGANLTISRLWKELLMEKKETFVLLPHWMKATISLIRPNGGMLIDNLFCCAKGLIIFFFKYSSRSFEIRATVSITVRNVSLVFLSRTIVGLGT